MMHERFNGRSARALTLSMHAAIATLVVVPVCAEDMRSTVPISNPSFEQGTVGWSIGTTSIVSAVPLTFIDGLLPSDGALMGLVVAGMMWPANAEQWMGLAPGTLQAYYESIGGVGAIGNYSVLRRNLPAGQWQFDWVSEDGDVENPEFLDHSFYVVNGVIHPLTNGLEAPRGQWSTETFTTTGGNAYFVSANGGDIALSPYLYLDNFRFAPVAVCPGDLDGDNHVGISDISVIVSHWSETGSQVPGDLNHDGVVGIGDVGEVIPHWGTTCGDT